MFSPITPSSGKTARANPWRVKQLPGHAIATQGETMEEERDMVRDAVQCHCAIHRAETARLAARANPVKGFFVTCNHAPAF